MKVVLDTNVLVSGVFWNGAPYRLLKLWTEEKIIVVATREILQEYARVLHAMDAAESLAEQWTAYITRHVEVVMSKKLVSICRDPFDDVFINCAIVGNAQYIVSGDKDLLSLDMVLDMPIVRPTTFLALLRKKGYTL